MPPVMKTRPNGSHARWRRQNLRSTGVPFVLGAGRRVAGFQGQLWFSLMPNPTFVRKQKLLLSNLLKYTIIP